MQPLKGSGRAGSKSKSPSWRRTPKFKNERRSPVVKNCNAEKVEPKTKLGAGIDAAFEDHVNVSHRMAKSLYFANKLPSTPRPSLPLTGMFSILQLCFCIGKEFSFGLQTNQWIFLTQFWL